MGLRLVIGNKNYSSWSFRPWLAMKVASIAFEETLISLEAPDFKVAGDGVGRSGQGADVDRRRHLRLGVAGDFRIPGREISCCRALARASGSARSCARGRIGDARRICRAATPTADEYPSAGDPRALDTDATGDVARIEAIWSECRSRFGTGGPFLYGAFTAADAMFAPVVWRFHTYAVEVSAVAQAYMRALMTLPAWHEWREAARLEPWVLPHDEVDWPAVKRE